MSFPSLNGSPDAGQIPPPVEGSAPAISPLKKTASPSKAKELGLNALEKSSTPAENRVFQIKKMPRLHTKTSLKKDPSLFEARELKRPSLKNNHTFQVKKPLQEHGDLNEAKNPKKTQQEKKLEIVAQIQVLNAQLQNVRIPVRDQDGNFRLIAPGEATGWPAAVDGKNLSTLIFVIRQEPLDGSPGSLSVGKFHEWANEKTVTIEGKTYTIQPDLTDEEIHAYVEIINQYLDLQSQLKQCKAEESALGILFSPTKMQVPKEQARIFSATSFKLPFIQESARTSTLFLNGIQARLDKEERAQEKDDLHAEEQRTVVQEGIKKSRIKNEQIEYSERPRLGRENTGNVKRFTSKRPG